MEDLEALAREEKASIDSLDAPGGGSVVRSPIPMPSGSRLQPDGNPLRESTHLRAHPSTTRTRRRGSTRSNAFPKDRRM